VLETGRRNSVASAGVFVTHPDRAAKSTTEDNAERFSYLARSLWELAATTKPERIFIEGTVFIPGKMTAASIHALGRVRGFADVVGTALNVEVIELSPHVVKKGLGISTKRGEGLASKEQVREAIVRIYPDAVHLIPMTNVGLNAFDAAAVAHVGVAATAFKDRLMPSGSGW
jgi:Holliday junction resolvasome RuvABC endonuclease subunit